ncbi:polysaccharide deacetylase family protein [Bordetella sp. BOR01]|uniref:polysaccharide deacetylase family protein n=1 Tax=Bordetella sp. BOR01 TaxID=2854779 RepID=UPI001C44F019|nr:polysaccharide deacetylase family protein [Bordetella sp. BOR01]MBV7483297.1 polysaccharide deacetylase family protein [Bordetella sp. BOR01]
MKKFDTKLDRYPFSAIVDRPTYRWKNGAGLAVYFALNIEAFEFGRNPGNDFTSMPSAPFHRGYAYRDYGNRVGVWRIKKLFDQFQFPLAVLANSSVYDVYPRVLEAFRSRGDEFVGHGRTNSERQIDMDAETERTMIAEVAGRMKQEEGQAPQGWLGPFISQSPRTPELLKELGFSYMLDWYFDEQPVWFRTDNGQILAVPYPSMELNDLPAYVNRGVSDTDFRDMMIDTFDEQLAESAERPLVYCVSLHTFLTGHPQRIRHLRQVLEHIAAHQSDIWFTTPAEIAAHVATLPVGTVPGDERS